MPPIFIGLPSTGEQIDSLCSYFDGIEGANVEVSESASIAEALVKLSSNAHLVFSREEKDIRAFFAEFCAFLQKLREGDSRENEIIDNTISSITKSTDQAILRLSLLNNLYNVFSTASKFRYNVFLSILNFAIETDNTKIVIPVLPQLKSLLEQWNSTPEQKQTIYKSVCELYKKNNPSSFVYYEALKVYLKTFEETNNEISESIPSSVEAAVLAIKLDNIHQCDDLLELKAIEQLKNDDKHSKIYQLLELFTGQKFDSFDEFTTKNPEFLESVNLSSTDCSKKIKLLSIATIAEENRELSYAKIAETLKVDVSEVELWIISAISAGLIDAKLDQANDRVLIRQCAKRVFGDDQWKQLQTKLNNWKANVQNMLANVESVTEEKEEDKEN